GGIELVPAQAEATALDLHPQEEGAAGCIADMLIGAKDIAVVQGDEAGDRCDQAPVIRAVDQEADVIAHGQSRSLPTLRGRCHLIALVPSVMRTLRDTASWLPGPRSVKQRVEIAPSRDPVAWGRPRRSATLEDRGTCEPNSRRMTPVGSTIASGPGRTLKDSTRIRRSTIW